MTFSTPRSTSCSASSATAPVSREHVPHPADPAARLAGQPHTHLARSPWPHRSPRPARSPARARRRESPPAPGRLILLRFRLLPLRLSSNPLHTVDKVGRLGASVKETEILTGVLEATMRDPSRSGPGAKLAHGLKSKQTSASAGDPTPFSRLRGVPQRDMEACLKVGFPTAWPTALPGCPDRVGPEIISPVLASSGTVAGLFSLLGAHEVRVWSPRQFPG